MNRFPTKLPLQRIAAILNLKSAVPVTGGQSTLTRWHRVFRPASYVISVRNCSTSGQSTTTSDRQGVIWFLVYAAFGYGVFKFINGRVEKREGEKLPILGRREELQSKENGSQETPKMTREALHVPYVVIGNSTSALMAARGIRIQDPRAQVLLIRESNDLPYKISELPVFLMLTTDELAEKHQYEYGFDDRKMTETIFYKDMFLKPEELKTRKNAGIALLKSTKVKQMFPKEQKILLDNGDMLRYDKCFVSAERKPKNLPVLENAEDKEVSQRTTVVVESADDFLRLYEVVRAGKRIAVIGSGDMATDLASVIGYKSQEVEGLQICQIFQEHGVMSNVFPRYLSKWATERIDKNHVDMFPATSITKCSFDRTRDQVVLTLKNGEELFVDHIIVAIETDENGKYHVDEQFHYKHNIWMASDGVTFQDPVLGLRTISGNAFEATAGRRAGENMAGAGKAFSHQPEISRTFCDGVAFACYGICDSDLRTVSYFALPSSQTTDNTQEAGSKISTESESDPYKGKGIVFYVQGSKVVGIMLWNIYGRHKWYAEEIARQVLKSHVKESDIDEVAKKMKLNTFPDYLKKLTKDSEEENDSAS